MSFVAGSPLPKSTCPNSLLLNSASTLRSSNLSPDSSLNWLTSFELFGDRPSSMLVPTLKSSVIWPRPVNSRRDTE